MVERKGDLPVKRDLLLLFLCLCVLSGAAWLGKAQVVPVAGTVSESDWILILDAGHGGEDGGASTASGSKESNINLGIVKKAELLMAFLGVETTLTRTEDVSIHSEGAATIRERRFRI